MENRPTSLIIFFIIYLLGIIGISIFGLTVLLKIEPSKTQTIADIESECHITYDNKKNFQYTLGTLIGINAIIIAVFIYIYFIHSEEKLQKSSQKKS
jgi:hypothetical protein